MDQITPDPMATTTLADLEAIRLLLRGSSVIDWHQLSFTDRREVDRFLRINEFEPDNAADMERLEQLRAEAVDYLTRHFDYRIPQEIAGELPAHELLLVASRRGRHQMYACMILKVMHVMQHLNGREILFKLPVSDDQVFGLVENKVVRVVEEIRAAGYAITEFSWSRKEKDSLITKLLAKRDSIAAHVYDKLRFRIIMKKRADIAAMLREMLHRLVPFNYVIPGETVNRILSLSQLVEQSPTLSRYLDQLQVGIERNDTVEKNEFSSPGYNAINFVADLPVRVESVLRHVSTPANESLASMDHRAVIFVLTEFQLIDSETALENEQGENSHEAYKERQHIQVKARLSRRMR